MLSIKTDPGAPWENKKHEAILEGRGKCQWIKVHLLRGRVWSIMSIKTQPDIRCSEFNLQSICVSCPPNLVHREFGQHDVLDYCWSTMLLGERRVISKGGTRLTSHLLCRSTNNLSNIPISLEFLSSQSMRYRSQELLFFGQQSICKAYMAAYLCSIPSLINAYLINFYLIKESMFIPAI